VIFRVPKDASKDVAALSTFAKVSGFMIETNQKSPNSLESRGLRIDPAAWVSMMRNDEVPLLGICFWREGVEGAFGPEQRG
jgi:hypothetical protein